MPKMKKERLSNRPPKTWLSLLNSQIRSDVVRCRVANIVWWDYASDMMDFMWDICYDFRDEYVPPKRIMRGLIRVGYDPAIARMRIRTLERSLA